MQKRAGIGVICALMLIAGAMAAVAVSASAVEVPPDSTKVTICHRTNSNSNYYVSITPDVSGVLNGHAGHIGPVWNPTLKSNHTKWGDIIPSFYYDGGQFFPGQNLDALGGPNLDVKGSAILANGCRIPDSPPPPDPGSLTVKKLVVGTPASPIDHFTFVVDCGDDDPTEVTVPGTGGTGTPVVEDIAAGSTCTVVETTVLPTGTVTMYDPAGANTTGVDIVSDSNVDVTATNTFPAPAPPTPEVSPATAVAAEAVTVQPTFTG